MREILIIGNGFDLAHGLKTSYQDFLRWLFELTLSNPDKINPIIRYSSDKRIEIDKIFEDRYRTQINTIFNFSSLFLNSLFKSPLVKDWNDLETQYFNQLKETPNPELLNKDFNLLKEFLVEYLIEEQTKFKKLDAYEKIFKSIDSKSERHLILNFNYTKTVSEYSKSLLNTDLINIHGELSNPYNQIIFGYSANSQENKLLLEKKQRTYLDNIKKYQYRRTDNKDKLDSFMRQSSTPINVNILGHSCGDSDANILSEILDHPNINRIKIFYFKDFEDYQTKQISIDRITSNHIAFNKIANFKQSEMMPQFNDEPQTQISSS